MLEPGLGYGLWTGRLDNLQIKVYGKTENVEKNTVNIGVLLN